MPGKSFSSPLMNKINLDEFTTSLNLPGDVGRGRHGRQVNGLLDRDGLNAQQVLGGAPQLFALHPQIDADAVHQRG